MASATIGRQLEVGPRLPLQGSPDTEVLGKALHTIFAADLIVPNADLVTQQVTNWTLSSRQVRLLIPVGVAYGSDVSLVIERLTTCAVSNEMVAKTPPPQVLFLSFGESSLDFELRVPHKFNVEFESMGGSLEIEEVDTHWCRRRYPAGRRRSTPTGFSP